MDVDTALTQLVDYALACELIEPEDRIWAYNAVLAATGLCHPEHSADAPPSCHPERGASAPSLSSRASADAPPSLSSRAERRQPRSRGISPDAAHRNLTEPLRALIAASREATGDHVTPSDDIVSRIMGVLTPRPSVVNRRFRDLLKTSPMQACSYLYRLSCDVDYVKRDAIARDIKWVSPSQWGELEITINLSKPEKDPRAIARAAQTSSNKRYPACQLCVENEGYAGRNPNSSLDAHPARQNLRIANLDLAGEQWGLQYSPYAYFDEHCIIMSKAHRPMRIDQSCFARLLEFVTCFDGYFIGSNADLPIVGGSILSHDHFQGGRHVFPMMNAPIEQRFTLREFPQIACGVVKWPVTVLRLRSDSAQALTRAAAHILEVWRSYSDDNMQIVAYSDGTPHNTITPIARKLGDEYVLDLALRCNVTSAEHPLGVFHPHEELHHIKKENIGLIEVMGLAVLPPRLQDELETVAASLVGNAPIDPRSQASSHADWAQDIRSRHPELDEDNVWEILRDEVAEVFAQVLEDAGVFKWDARGRAALERFLEALSS